MSSKLGLCLTSGGAKGAYQIGALKALDRLGLFSKIEAFSGTSIGAANAAVVASRSIETAKDIWFNIPDDSLQSSRRRADNDPERHLSVLDRGIYRLDTFEELIMESVDYEALRRREVYVTVTVGGKEGAGLLELVKASYRHYMQKDSTVLYLPLEDLSNKEIHNGADYPVAVMVSQRLLSPLAPNSAA